MIDTQSPELRTPFVERLPGGGGILRIPLVHTDLDQTSLTATGITVEHPVLDADGNEVPDPKNAGNPIYSDVFAEGDPKYEEAPQPAIVLYYRSLASGNYRVTVKNIKDLVGNVLASESKTFTVPGGREFAEQIEYPRFLRPEGKVDEFNPGDRVDTRVVRLYYFRDARRVAELINRNVRNLNQVGYDEAQRFAAEARQDFEQKKDRRTTPNRSPRRPGRPARPRNAASNRKGTRGSPDSPPGPNDAGDRAAST